MNQTRSNLPMAESGNAKPSFLSVKVPRSGMAVRRVILAHDLSNGNQSPTAAARLIPAQPQDTGGI
jgi:hypothetical protein